jgi:hypothetical protein
MQDILSSDDAELIDPQQLFLDEIERRRQLEQATQAAAEVVYDLQGRGPLYRYMLTRRARAAAALAQLVDIDPKDAAAIAAAQVTVREYVEACRWIDSVLNDGQMADAQIRAEYGDPKGGDPDPAADTLE